MMSIQLDCFFVLCRSCTHCTHDQIN